MISIMDNILGAVGSIMPQSMINGIGKIESTVNNATIHLVAAKSSSATSSTTTGSDPFSKLDDKMENVGATTKQFVEFCQRWIWIPTVFIVLFVIIVFAFGNVQEKSQAKKRLIWLIAGLAGLMFITTIVTVIMNFFMDNYDNNMSSFTS